MCATLVTTGSISRMPAGAHLASMVDGPQGHCQPAGHLSAEIGLRVLTPRTSRSDRPKAKPPTQPRRPARSRQTSQSNPGYGQIVKSTVQRY
jgi:hypothetical protein